jgi:hypothetical protein
MDFLGGLALPDDHFGIDADQLPHLLAGLGKCRLGLFHRLGAHDLLDAEPVLEIAGLDDIDQNQATAGIESAHAGIAHGAFAFGRVVDDRQELAAVAGLAGTSS